MRGDVALLRVTADPWPEHQHRREADPAANRMHHDGTGEIMKLFAERALQIRLKTVGLIPRNAFKKWVDKSDQQKRGDQLRIEFRTLGDATGDDGGNRRCEREQEEKFDQFIAAPGRQLLRTGEKIDAIRNRIADEKIGDA